MKDNPKRRKTKNTFRFQTFSDRISQIDIDIYRSVQHPNEDEDEDDGIFYSRCLKRLKNDNFSAEFTELCKVLPRDVCSLPVLKVQHRKLVDILVNHIRSCDLEALPPALQLLVAIAHDLREVFYPCFHPLILQECVRLSDTREPEQIECVFNCLAHMFKYLRSSIIKNISHVLPDLLPLLSSSRPKYINEFAAESFAFVARKVHNKPAFIKLSLKNVKKNRDELVGVARLFFEVIKNVGQQFHSCAKEFLTLLLRELSNEKWSELLLIICENLISDITRFVTTNTDVSVIWESFFDVGNEFSTMWVQHADNHSACNLHMILKLAEKLVTSRELILKDPEKFMAFLLPLGKDPKVQKFNQLHEIIIDIVSYILSQERFSLQINNTTDIIIKIIENIEDEELLVRFCEPLIKLPQYELLVFREFLKLFGKKSLNKFSVRFLVKIIWMKTNFSVSENHKLQFYFTCLRSVPDSFQRYLLDSIPDKLKQITFSSAEEILYAILILSGMEECRESFCKKTDNAIAQLCRIIKNEDGNEEHVAKILYTLLMAYQYRSTCSDFLQVNYEYVFETAMKYVDSCNYLCSLRLLQFKTFQNNSKALYYNKDSFFNNLSSPFHKVRLFTLQVLVKMESDEVFEMMLNIESIIPSIENYREKLSLLQKLEYREELTSYSVAVVKFLFGNLYINFQYLWEPTQKLIKSYLENVQSIWPTVQDQLEDSVVSISNNTKMLQNFSVNFEADCIREHFYELNGVDDRPDFHNFRCLLLESLVSASHLKFTSECFAVNLFLKFINSEYKNVSEDRNMANVKTDEELSDTENADMEDGSEKYTQKQRLKPDANLNKLLVSFLKLLDKFPFLVPPNKSKELKKIKSDVEDIYSDFLTNKNSDIQQLAVAFICKGPRLSVHKESLQRLAKDISLKDELLQIKLDTNRDEAGNRVEPTNRDEVEDQPQIKGIPHMKEKPSIYKNPEAMKIVLRILFGKVKRKCPSQLRDSIFEFLAGCEDKYVIEFFKLFFNCAQLKDLDKADSPLPQSYLTEEDVKNSISLSCLSSYASTVVDLFNRCGHLLRPPCLKYLLRVLFKIMANWRMVSTTRAEMPKGCHGLMNKIRLTSFAAIIYFVDNYDYYWSRDEMFRGEESKEERENRLRVEMDVLLQLFVDPWVEKIPEECLQSPNQAMRLLIAFTNNTKYFPILARRSGTLSPIDAIVRLLNSDKTYFNVKNTTLEIIERLLTLEGDIKDRSQVSSTSDFDLFYLLDKELVNSYERDQHLGKILLQPHIPTILQYLQKQLTKKYFKLDGLYMLILQNISAFALDEASSCRLLDLLMPTLRNKATAEDSVVLPLLQVIRDLFKTLKNYDNFEKYLLRIGQLFNVVTSGTVRGKLCELVKDISKKTNSKLVDYNLVNGLNLNDKRSVDQPDFAGRSETFKQIKLACDSGKLSLYSGIFIVYNCIYTVKTEKDMGLREHAGLCLKRVCPALCTKYANSPNELNLFLNSVLLPLIKEGIESKLENYQLESVVLLGHMVRECKSAHFVFKNLFPLCDPPKKDEPKGDKPKEKKPELENDFFENICHLQNFRRIKALKRFNEIMSLEEKPMHPYSLMILRPLISQYLLSQKFSAEHSLINNAIEALKIICHFCPWRQYQQILKLYIFEMRKNISFRKQAIRIVSTILDAFHFDISQANEDDFRRATTSSTEKGTVEKEKSKGAVEKEESEDEPMEVDEEEVVRMETSSEPVVKRVNVLGRSDAVRVYRTIKTFLIPSLDNAFMVYEDAEKHHKLSKKTSNVDKEELAVMSIPVSFAAIKLLKRLPNELLESYISRVFLKLCTYLQSRLPSIRLTARETMQNILLEVGPSYLPQLLEEMKSILTNGFQVHVLVFTTHAVLEKLQSTFTEGVIDPCIDLIHKICIVDLFGKVAEEKEVEKISSTIPETKGNISYNMLRILAEYASESHILKLVSPFKEVMASHMSSKRVLKVSRCLHYITTGLTHNKFVPAESLLTFANGVSHDRIPQLVAERDNGTARLKPETPRKKQDSLLLPEDPRHKGAETRKICIRTNAHVFIAFGLELLSALLKREMIVSTAYLPYLDPFVPLINDCLQSQHVVLIVLALKCLSRLLPRDLPKMEENIQNILDSVFSLFGKYSLNGTTTKNEELVMAATKVAQVLMQPKLHLKIPAAELQILLYVVEDMLKNRTHYATGYSVLGTIISRECDTVEFHQLLRTTANLSIQSYHDDMRYKAQDALCRYMMYYAPHKKYCNFIKFYISQLEYAEQFGRKSALEMLKKLIDGIRLMEKKAKVSSKKQMYESRVKVTKSAFLDLSPVVFVQLSFRLMVDDSPECKKMAADLISDIISFTAGEKEGNDLYFSTLTWLKDSKKIRNRRLAVQLLGLFVVVQEEKFLPKLNTVWPLMIEQFRTDSSDGPGKFVRAPVLNVSTPEEADKDHLLFQVLKFYSTVFNVYPEFLSDKSKIEDVSLIGENCKNCLKHEHEWVRLEAARVLVAILKAICKDDSEIAEIASTINGKSAYSRKFLREEKAKSTMASLCKDLCDQLAPGADVREELRKAIAINLRYIAEVLQYVEDQDDAEVLENDEDQDDAEVLENDEDQDDTGEKEEQLSLRWLLERVSKQCALEVVRSPFKYSVRNIVFNYFATLEKILEKDKLGEVLPIIMLPILRELSTTDEQGVEIRRVAKEVLSSYRSLEQYDAAVTEVQRILDIKRAKRKSQRAHMNILDPERAARRKVKIQLKKKEQRKRRLERIRKRKFRSGKKKPVVIDDD